MYSQLHPCIVVNSDLIFVDAERKERVDRDALPHPSTGRVMYDSINRTPRDALLSNRNSYTPRVLMQHPQLAEPALLPMSVVQQRRRKLVRFPSNGESDAARAFRSDDDHVFPVSGNQWRTGTPSPPLFSWKYTIRHADSTSVCGEDFQPTRTGEIDNTHVQRGHMVYLECQLRSG